MDRRELEARSWIEAVLGDGLPSDDLHECLRDGVLLCNLLNNIRPGTVKKINKSKIPFMQMENINWYLQGVRTLGILQEFEMFMTVDLYEAKNLGQVITHLHALGRSVQKLADYDGPILGVKMADKNPRKFSEEQLQAGKFIPSFISKGSYGGATASGSIDTSRNIIKGAPLSAAQEARRASNASPGP